MLASSGFAVGAGLLRLRRRSWCAGSVGTGGVAGFAGCGLVDATSGGEVARVVRGSWRHGNGRKGIPCLLLQKARQRGCWAAWVGVLGTVRAGFIGAGRDRLLLQGA